MAYPSAGPGSENGSRAPQENLVHKPKCNLRRPAPPRPGHHASDSYQRGGAAPRSASKRKYVRFSAQAAICHPRIHGSKMWCEFRGASPRPLFLNLVELRRGPTLVSLAWWGFASNSFKWQLPLVGLRPDVLQNTSSPQRLFPPTSWSCAQTLFLPTQLGGAQPRPVPNGNLELGWASPRMDPYGMG